MSSTQKAMRAAIYSRVSTDMQEEKDSLHFQIERNRMYCNFRNFEIVREYSDVESGGNDNRDDYLKLIDGIKNNEFDVIVVVELSRISRKLKTVLEFLELIQNYNVDFISINQNFDTTTAIGRAMISISAVFAQLEREQTSERVSNQLRTITLQTGRKLGATPLGYDKVNKLLEINQEEAELVNAIFNSALKGESLMKIGEAFNMPHGTIKRILMNQVYVGKVIYGKLKNNIVTGKRDSAKPVEVEGIHESIINEKVFEQVQLIIKNKSYNLIKGVDNPRFLLGGLMKCYCGHSIYGALNTRKKTYYYCNDSRKGSSGKGCTKKGIVGDSIEKSIIEEVLKMKLNPTFETMEPSQNKEHTSTIEKLEQNIKDLKTKREKLVKLLVDEIITATDFKTQESEINKAADLLEKQISDIKLEANYRENKVNNKELFLDILSSFDKNMDRVEMKKLLFILIREIRFINDFEYEIIYNV